MLKEKNYSRKKNEIRDFCISQRNLGQLIRDFFMVTQKKKSQKYMLLYPQTEISKIFL